MRIPEKDEDLAGKVCVCSIGRPAVVISGGYSFAFDNFENQYYIGLGLDGKGNWCASHPCIIAESTEEYYFFNERLKDKN